MKRAALFYSGQLRNFKECFPTHLDKIISVNSNYKFDIYGHFWHDKSLQGVNFRSHLACPKEKSQWDINSIMDFLQADPEQMKFQKPIDFKSDLIADPRFPHPIHNVKSMFYSMHESNSLKGQHSPTYEVSIRIRTDLYFLKDLDFSNFDLESINVHDEFCHTDYGINDIFAFGPTKQMDKYFSIYPFLEDYAYDGCAVNPECFLGYHLKRMNTPIKKNNLQNNYYKVFRDL